MKDFLVKDLMIPLANYVTTQEDDTLYDVFRILEEKRTESGHAHRDAVVVDKNGNFRGKVTMIDIFKNLEPNYKRLFKNYKDGTLTKNYVLNSIKDLKLWLDPIQSLCKRGQGIKVSEIMYIPESCEFIKEEDSLEKALHEYVMDVHQPLVVKKDNQVTGFLRFGDLFEVIREQMLSSPTE